MKIGDTVVHKEWRPYNEKEMELNRVWMIMCGALPPDWYTHLEKMPREIIRIEHGLLDNIFILENRYSARDLPQIEVSEKRLNNFWILYNENNYFWRK